MPYDQPFVELNLKVPPSLEKICGKYDTKVTISHVVQTGFIGGYGLDDSWIISVYLLSDICSNCGQLKIGIGTVPVREKCSYHKWDHQAIAILLFHGRGDNLAKALADTEQRAARFLQDPDNWGFHVELLLDRREFVNCRQASFERSSNRHGSSWMTRHARPGISLDYADDGFIVTNVNHQGMTEILSLAENEGFIVESEEPQIIADLREKSFGEKGYYHHQRCNALPDIKDRQMFDDTNLAERDGYKPCPQCSDLFEKPQYRLTRVRRQTLQQA